MNIKKISAVVLLGMTVTTAAYAATQGFTAAIRFLEPLSFNTAVNPDMGDWLTALAGGRDMQLLTDGTVAGTDSADYIGGLTVGSVNVVGSGVAAIDIVANNFVANGGITIDDIPCKYGAAAATVCAAGISAAAAPTTGGTALLLGVDASSTAANSDGDIANPTFDIVVSYN